MHMHVYLQTVQYSGLRKINNPTKENKFLFLYSTVKPMHTINLKKSYFHKQTLQMIDIYFHSSAKRKFFLNDLTGACLLKNVNKSSTERGNIRPWRFLVRKEILHY